MSRRWTYADLPGNKPSSTASERRTQTETTTDKGAGKMQPASVEQQEKDFILDSLERTGRLPEGAVLTHNKSYEGKIRWKNKVHTLKLS